MMSYQTQFKKQNKEPTFVKGMTLAQYLSNFPTLICSEEDVTNKEKQQCLYQSSHYALRKRMQSKNSQFQIEEIDQVSIQDSIQYEKPQKTRATPSFQPHQRLKQKREIPCKQESMGLSGFNLSLRSRSSLYNRQYSQKNSIDKNSFRVKKMSISPAEKMIDDIANSCNITQYKKKFDQNTKKEQTKMPEILTFYGKLSMNEDQPKLKKKSSLKGVQLKQNMKKKNHLQLKQLVMLQTKIKNIKNLGTTHREIKQTSVKDKLVERKEKPLQRQ